jgi:hypothetical protein
MENRFYEIFFTIFVSEYMKMIKIVQKISNEMENFYF